MTGRFDPLPDLACEITPELDQRIKDVSREAHALHLAVMPALYVGAQVRDADGAVVEDRRYKANSFNRNFWNMLAIWLTGTQNFLSGDVHGEGKLTIRRATNSNVLTDLTAVTGGGVGMSAANGAGIFFIIRATDTVSGIVIGTSNAAENFNGIDLGAMITHGTGAGQMQIMAPTSSSNPNYSSADKTYENTFSRVFKNLSGTSMGVNEVGIRGTAGNQGWPVLYERTVFPAPLTVPNGSLIEVAYTIVFHYPEPS